ncbi:TRAP transporter substrate-binding protein [Neomoorella humiferrea]|uniref:TRAP transporter substrate-binding protein n=1 Tax=Neomoorella humiferrea TaxID=676965 RepID=UPI003D8D7879
MVKKSRFCRWLVISLVVGLFTVAIAGCGSSNNKQQSEGTKQGTINLRLADVVQPTHPMNVAAEKFAKKVQEKSNGRIKITIYPARQLGDDRQLFEQVQQGSLDMAEISVAPMGSTNPIVMALQMPFLFTDWDQYTKVIKSEATDKLLKGLEKNNVKALAVYNAGFRHILTVNKPIKTPADLQGMKFRTAETPLHVDIFKALGANPTPMPYGEIYSGLQNKVIDGLEMDLSAILMEKHYEVAKDVTLSKHFTWPAILMINTAKFNSLTPEDQKIIQDAAKEVIDENVKDIAEIEKKAVSELTAKGVKMIELSASELAPFIEATKGVEQKYSSQDPAIAEFVKAARNVK